MINRFARDAYFYDLVLTSRPDWSTPRALHDLVQFIKDCAGPGGFVFPFENGKRSLRLIDCQLDDVNEALVLLISLADREAADPAFENMETGVPRVEAKAENEGIAVASHVAISTKPYKENHPVYVVVHEKVVGVGKTRLVNFLRSLFKYVSEKAEFQCRKDGQVFGQRIIPEIRQHGSDKLKSALENGSLLGFDLVSYDYNDTEFDEPGVFSENRRSVSVQVSSKKKGSWVIPYLNAAVRKAKARGFKSVRLTYDMVGSGKDQRADISTDCDDVGESVLFKNIRIILEEPIEQRSESIHSELKDKMIEHLIETRGVES